MTTAGLLLGPLLRHVDATSASIWVETRGAARVVVGAAGRAWSAPTFAVHGHHYALVALDGLEPGTQTPYTVQVDGTPVWPEPGSDFPPSVVATPEPGGALRLVYGSCRTSVPHDAAGNRSHGVDAMRAYALAMASNPSARRPDLLLLLGDQVYADETAPRMREFIESRRDIGQPPGAELKDYEEYAHLYRLAWSDPANRWLLSTLPTAMIFDDHDIRDDWNTSASWREDMARKPWWRDRIVGGLASYWVYQHLGNLSVRERQADPLYREVLAGSSDGAEVDLSDRLDAFAERADRAPGSYRWSFARDIGGVRLLVVDSRAARVLEPGRRSMLDATERAWLDEELRGGCRHLLIATSLPFLLPVGLHHLEAWDEALSAGTWGRRAGWLGERIRRGLDLEHWAAFQRSFQALAATVLEVADGRRGTAPDTVMFLSGDVHFSYVAEVDRDSGSRIVQSVCSPIRNPLPRPLRFATALASYGLAGPIGAVVARSARVPSLPFRWRTVKGPWFDNNLATLEETDEGLRMWWERGVVHSGDHERPRLEQVTSLTVPARQRRDPVPGGT